MRLELTRAQRMSVGERRSPRGIVAVRGLISADRGELKVTIGSSLRPWMVACVAVLSGCAAEPEYAEGPFIEHVVFTIPPQLAPAARVSGISESDLLESPGAEEPQFFYLQGTTVDDGRIRLYAEHSIFHGDEWVGPARKFAALETFFREQETKAGTTVTISEQSSFDFDSVPGYQFAVRVESPDRKPKLRVIRALHVESQDRKSTRLNSSHSQ